MSQYIQELLQKMAPKSIDIVLEAFIKTWEAATQQELNVGTPHLTLLLDTQYKIKGELIHIDFEESMLSLRLDDDSQHLQVAFINYREVKHFILHELENYPEFLEELLKL